MAKLRALILAGGAVLALARAAAAADLLPPPPALEPPPPADGEFNGWYLRGDVGLGINATTPNLAVSPDPLAAGLAGGTLSTSATNTFYNPTISSSGIFDFGFGYQFNNWFRADVTGEYRGGATFQTLEVLTDPTILTGQDDGAAIRRLLSRQPLLVHRRWSTAMSISAPGTASRPTSAPASASPTTSCSASPTPATPITGNGVQSPDRRLFRRRRQDELRLGADGRPELRRHPEPQARISATAISTTASSPPAPRTACTSGPGFSAGFCGGSSYAVYSKNDLASNDFRIGLRWMIGEAATPPPPKPRWCASTDRALVSDRQFAAPACSAPLSFCVGRTPRRVANACRRLKGG